MNGQRAMVRVEARQPVRERGHPNEPSVMIVRGPSPVQAPRQSPAVAFRALAWIILSGGRAPRATLPEEGRQVSGPLYPRLVARLRFAHFPNFSRLCDEMDWNYLSGGPRIFIFSQVGGP